MSLGVPGYALHPDWRKIFGDWEVWTATQNRVFVVAAGNDGISQVTNINWNCGSRSEPDHRRRAEDRWNYLELIEPAGNGVPLGLPGRVLPQRLVPREADEPLHHRAGRADPAFPTARAASSGAAAPRSRRRSSRARSRCCTIAGRGSRSIRDETVDIILQSARDAGAPGVDPVYGRGILDIQASQEPLELQQFAILRGAQRRHHAADRDRAARRRRQHDLGDRRRPLQPLRADRRHLPRLQHPDVVAADRQGPHLDRRARIFPALRPARPHRLHQRQLARA